MNKPHYKILLFGAFLPLLIPIAAAQDVEPLVSVGWLEENIDNENLLVVDLPHRIKDYNRGHIPGAVFVDWRKDIIDPESPDLYTLPTKEAWQTLMSRLGVQADTHLVLTDNLDNRVSVRMYWSAKFFGHKHISVLDGGTNSWQQAGNRLSQIDAIIVESDYRVTQMNEQVRTSLETVRAAVEDGDIHLLDGRPNDQYTGESPGKVYNTGKEHKRRGHAATALNIPWKDNIDDDGTFKSINDLADLYKDNGIGMNDEVITYCNEGLHAAMPWFVLHELLKEEKVTLYDDSMAEWANLDDTPMESDKR